MSVSPKFSRRRRLWIATGSLLLGIVACLLLIKLTVSFEEPLHFRASFTFAVSPLTNSILSNTYQRRLFKSYSNVRLEQHPGTNLIDIVVRSQSPKSAEDDCYAAILLFRSDFRKNQNGMANQVSVEANLEIEEHSVMRDELRPRANALVNKVESFFGK